MRTRVMVLILALSLTVPAALPAEAAGCAIQPIFGFGQAWQQPAIRQTMGCPLAKEGATYAAYQPFEHGFMLWRDDTDEIYVFYSNDDWARYIDVWQEGMPERAEILSPPVGRQQPKRGFGSVWLRRPEVRRGLGWALVEEVPTAITFQPYERGQMLWSHHTGVLVLPASHWLAPLGRG